MKHRGGGASRPSLRRKDQIINRESLQTRLMDQVTVDVDDT
jgi:hypothetical protein